MQKTSLIYINEKARKKAIYFFLCHEKKTFFCAKTECDDYTDKMLVVLCTITERRKRRRRSWFFLFRSVIIQGHQIDINIIDQTKLPSHNLIGLCLYKNINLLLDVKPQHMVKDLRYIINK